MKVLIVEDDQNKLKQLVNYIRDNWPNSTVEEKRSYQSGLKELIQTKYDLLILDMTMPTFDISPREKGGRPRAFAGKDILSSMEWKKINVPVIIVTQFESFGEGENTTSLEELRKQLKLAYKQYMGTVFYSAASDTWKEELGRIIRPFVVPLEEAEDD